MTTATFTGLIEFRPGFVPPVRARHVLFDFDGTLSLVRQGWPEVMVPMFAELIPRLPGESEDQLRRLLLDDIMTLNGKQTIYQMMRFAGRVAERGGQPREPQWYKHEYLRRLELRIAERVAGLRSGAVLPDELLVYGSRRLLDELIRRGLILHLASGTDEAFVRREAELLGLARYFGGRIHGAQDDLRAFSKAMVIERILREHGLDGSALLAFGDGYVEIENTKQVGGAAVAVASDEARNGVGLMDPWKRERLLGVGADVCVPDYRDAEALIEMLLGSAPCP